MYKSWEQPRHDPTVTRLRALLLSPLRCSSCWPKDPVNICRHSVRWWHFPRGAGNDRQPRKALSQQRKANSGCQRGTSTPMPQSALRYSWPWPTRFIRLWSALWKQTLHCWLALGRCSWRNLLLSGLLPLSRHDRNDPMDHDRSLYYLWNCRSQKQVLTLKFNTRETLTHATIRARSLRN